MRSSSRIVCVFVQIVQLPQSPEVISVDDRITAAVFHHFLPSSLRIYERRRRRFLSVLRRDGNFKGHTVYYMLTGQFPRDLKGRDAIVEILHSETVPIRDRESKVPKPVAKVIDRALSSDPEKRFRDAAQMKVFLKRAFAQVRG